MSRLRCIWVLVVNVVVMVLIFFYWFRIPVLIQLEDGRWVWLCVWIPFIVLIIIFIVTYRWLLVCWKKE